MKYGKEKPVLLGMYGKNLYKITYRGTNVTSRQIETVARNLKGALDDLCGFKVPEKEYALLTYFAAAQIPEEKPYSGPINLGHIKGMGLVYSEEERRKTLSDLARKQDLFCRRLLANFQAGAFVDLDFVVDGYLDYVIKRPDENQANNI